MLHSVFDKKWAALGLISLVAACVTPMSVSEIEDVTTCRDTTLNQIRKNLLLAGYEIEEQTGEDLVTDWKQTGGYNKSKYLQRLTVVKLDKGLFRFKVMKRSVTVDRENQATLTTTTRNKKKNESERVGIAFGRDVERYSDYDQSYYQERQADYRQTQVEVCGS